VVSLLWGRGGFLKLPANKSWRSRDKSQLFFSGGISSSHTELLSCVNHRCVCVESYYRFVNDASHGKRSRPVEGRRVTGENWTFVCLSFDVKNLSLLHSKVIRSRRGRMLICTHLLSCNRHAYIICTHFLSCNRHTYIIFTHLLSCNRHAYIILVFGGVTS
jgi:hypothetical protein